MDARQFLVVSGENFKNSLQERLASQPPLFSVQHFCWAQSCHEVLAKLGRSQFDLLLLEHDPPAIDGLTLYSQIIASGLACPTILILKEGDQPEAVKALQAGIQAYLIQGRQERYLELLPALAEYASQLWHEQQFNHPLSNKPDQELRERRQAEKALEKAYQCLTFYAENSPLFTVEWDNQLRVTYWSHEAEEFFGWRAEQVYQKSLADWSFVHEDDLPTAWQFMQRLRDGQEQGNLGLFRNFTQDGSIVHCEWYNSALLDETGKLVSIISLVLDVTARRQAIIDLEDNEQRFRHVVSSISDHIYIGEITVDGQTRYTSPNVEALTGFRPEKFADWSFWQTLIHPEDLPVAENQRWDTDQNSEVEYRMRRADDKLIWVRDSRRIEVEKDSQGRVKGRFVYGVVSDITERKLAEMALIQERMLLAKRVEERTAELSTANAELARAARLKDEFLANMSHELRTPLNAILGKSETLQEGVYGQLKPDQLRSLRMIEESGRHLLSLINDILDVSKIEAGKLELDIRPVSVPWMCETSLRLVKEMANRKNLTVLSTLDPAVTIIPADARRLKQILVNLLSNAVKFTPEGGAIGLDVKGDLDREVVQFTVWDTGIGIPGQDVHRLFEPFVQLDSSLSRQFVGTGLGLSLVYRMTELHGGGVSVNSQENKGSRFTVSLPWPKETPHKTEAREQLEDEAIDPVTVTWYTPGTGRSKIVAGPGTATKKLILIVEDNEANIDTLSEYLPYKGFRIIVARNGNEAIDRAREAKPDLILMDIQTPGMDGLTATRYIREDPTIAGIPIIALTALAMPGDRERCLAAGVNEYLSKPVSLRRLLTTIKEQLGLKTPVQVS